MAKDKVTPQFVTIEYLEDCDLPWAKRKKGDIEKNIPYHYCDCPKHTDAYGKGLVTEGKAKIVDATAKPKTSATRKTATA